MKRFGLRCAAPGAGELIRWLLCALALVSVLVGNGLLPMVAQDARLGNFFSPAQGVGLEGLSDKALRPARGVVASWKKVYQYAPNPIQRVDPLGLSGTSPVQSASDVADQTLANGQSKGAASVLRTANGYIYTGVSGETVTPANKDMLGVLTGTPVDQQAKWHGGCAEIAAMSKALNAGEHLDGSSMKTVNIGRSGTGHGTPKSACCTCAFTMKHYNVKHN